MFVSLLLEEAGIFGLTFKAVDIGFEVGGSFAVDDEGGSLDVDAIGFVAVVGLAEIGLELVEGLGIGCCWLIGLPCLLAVSFRGSAVEAEARAGNVAD